MPKVALVFCCNAKGYYYPGEFVRGFCQLFNIDGNRINKIRLEIEGFANVAWSPSTLKAKKKEELQVLYLESTILIEQSKLFIKIQ